MKPVLEIIIPTFNRPKSAQKAIESVLACNDDRLTVRCNSNGYEPALEKYRDLDIRVKYDSFTSNKGALANGLKLLTETNAKFCMLLSDEDSINSKNYKSILTYLESLESDIKAVSCSIFDSDKNKYFWKPHPKLLESNSDNFVALSPISTYMSGLIWRTDSLRAIDIKDLHNPTIGNVYSHLEITLHLLLEGKLKFYHDRFVEKGEDQKFGGDGYSHKSEDSTGHITDTKQLDLNPLVYGPGARARQFYYRENILNKLKSNIGFISLCMGKLHYVIFFYTSIMKSEETVIFPKNMTIKGEVFAAYNNSKDEREYSGSITPLFFTLLFRLPNLVSATLILFLRILIRIMRKVYTMKLTFNLR